MISPEPPRFLPKLFLSSKGQRFNCAALDTETQIAIYPCTSKNNERPLVLTSSYVAASSYLGDSLYLPRTTQ